MYRCFVVLGVIRLIVVRKKEERVRRKRDRVSLEEVGLMEKSWTETRME